MKIVVGIDDSPHSEAALKWVRDMRWPEGTLVTLISVPEVVSYTLSEASGAGLYEEIHQEQVRSCRELVARATTELPSEHLVVEGRVEHGDPRSAIVSTAEAVRADLIVVGSHGRTGLPRLLMGSVANYVVDHAPCTVVVVKRTREPHPKS